MEAGRVRPVIEHVTPEVDAGRFAAKRTLGERVWVEADVFLDGHDVPGCVLQWRERGADAWNESPMVPLTNDRWRGSFTPGKLGLYEYTVAAWVDQFGTWRHDFEKRVEAKQDLSVDLRIGAALLEDAARRTEGEARAELTAAAAVLRGRRKTAAVQTALGEELSARMAAHPDRSHAAMYGQALPLWVDRERARYSTWYELFPRSAGPAGSHGTFRDVEARLPYLAELGFDVLYLPPIHPIGRAFRKGKNNTTEAAADDVGSPWAIGATEGGHKAIHPDLGTLADFAHLVAAAGEYGIEIALDLAFQCSPDHPYVKEHPEWFRMRPDGTIQYAENPPKKYQDIYPFDFECEQWPALWDELKSVVDYWIAQGVRIFRVDNPHTKPFPFWEWLIAEVQREQPEVLFLAEAFTRPRVMQYLAKIGFSQSYTYFTWRNHQWDLREYFTELTTPPVRDFFRPNLWPNTPDILHEFLQTGGRPAFVIRLVLAATLGANYGIYGPAFELMEGAPREPGSEEYLHSEKYELRKRDPRADSLSELIARVNRIRRENPALQRDDTLRFHPVDNERLLCYSKEDDAGDDVMITVVNLDPAYVQSGWIEVPVEEWGLAPDQSYQVHDLLTDARYEWTGPRNYVQLNPHSISAHIFRLRYRDRARTEQEFEYFL